MVDSVLERYKICWLKDDKKVKENDNKNDLCIGIYLIRLIIYTKINYKLVKIEHK